MANDAFQKIKDSTNRAFTKISVKTSSTLEKSKIKLHMDTLSRDVQALMTDVGENLYVLWEQGNPSYEALAVKLNAIKQKKQEISELAAELTAIDARDNEILGTKPAVEPQPVVSDPNKSYCPGCGAEYTPGAKFCGKCGQKLQ